jgi:hypothetical protein
MRRIAFAVGLAGFAAVVPAAMSASSASRMHVTLTPAVSLLRGRTTITVAGPPGIGLSVRLEGASTRAGGPAGWMRLRYVDGAWRGMLSAPPLRGVYPIRLRTARGPLTEPTTPAFLRVYTRRTAREPSFADPRGVVRWWVARRGARLTAWKPWRLSSLDRRDRRLHRLFVIAYRKAGRPTLGIFITAVRDGFGGRWRLLEATVEPPGVVPGQTGG